MRSPIQPFMVLIWNLSQPLSTISAEEDQRQREQVLQARELQAEEAGGGVGLRELAALDRLVDDGLRQVERQVVDHHGADHQRHDQQLVALAVADDEAEKAAFHLAVLLSPPRSR